MAPSVKTKKHVPEPDETYAGQPARWQVFVDGEYAGWCERRTERRGSYYGDWQYRAVGQPIEWDDTKRSCVAALTAAALTRKVNHGG